MRRQWPNQAIAAAFRNRCPGGPNLVTVIKRYANRKLYDTQAKRYVTLELLAALVRRGEEVRVVDHASGDDITDLILAQIIFEREKREKGGLPQVTLKAMIRASSEALDHLRSALPWPAAAGAQVDDEILRRINLLVEWGDLTPEQGAQLGEQLAEAGEHLNETAQVDPAAVARELQQRGVPTRAELQVLEQRLAELAAELDRLAANQGPAPEAQAGPG